MLGKGVGGVVVLLAMFGIAWCFATSNGSSNRLDAITSSLNYPDQVLHVMWTTKLIGLEQRHLKVLESYLYHHPGWEAKLYISDQSAPKLLSLYLKEYLCHGFKVTIIFLNDDWLDQLGAKCPEGKEWLDNRAEWKSISDGYYHSHLTDFLRFCLLYTEGGVYSDLDALLLKPMDLYSYTNQIAPGLHKPQARLFIGKDLADPKIQCEWCLGSGQYYLAPGLMGVDKPGCVVLKEAMQLGFDLATYNPRVFNGAGPKAITMAGKRLLSTVSILSQATFYPVNYMEAQQLFNSQPTLEKYSFQDAKSIYGKIRRTSASLHFFGSTTKNAIVQRDSILDLAFRDIQLFIQTGSKINVPPFISVVAPYISLNIIRISLSPDLVEIPFRVELQVIEGSLVNVAMHQNISTMLWEKSVVVQGTNLANLNNVLNKIIYQRPISSIDYTGHDKLQITLTRLDTHMVIEDKAIPIYDISKLVTIVTKTMDRMTKVIELVASIKGPSGPENSAPYPDISIIVGDDGENASKHKEGMKRGFYYVPFPFDIGLSEGRNRLVDRVNTDYFLIIDDDFVFYPFDSDLGTLVHAIEEYNFDIAAGKSPVDQSRHQTDYCGRLKRIKDKLILFPGTIPIVEKAVACPCDRVDFVPNLFLAKTVMFKTSPNNSKPIRWDPELKVGEHEEFFYRARKHGLYIATCPTVAFEHRSEAEWTKSTAYGQLRGRVFKFMEQALRKHRLNELISFGSVTMRLHKLSPESLYNVQFYNLQPFCAEVSWDSIEKFHYYQIVATPLSADQQQVKEVGKETIVYADRLSKEQAAPMYAKIFGLEPDSEYRIMVRPANHTDIAPTGPTIWLKTPRPDDAENLLINGSFDGSNQGWKKTLGALTILIPVHYDRKRRHFGQIQGRVESDWCRKLSGLKWKQDFAMALYTSLEYLQKIEDKVFPPGYGIYQIVPAEKIPKECRGGESTSIPVSCQVSVGAWLLVDKIYGPPTHINLSLQLGIRWQRIDTSKDGKNIKNDNVANVDKLGKIGDKAEYGSSDEQGYKEIWHEEQFDPYKATQWQQVAFSVGIVADCISSQQYKLHSIIVRGWLAAQRGAVFFDDFYLAVRPSISSI